MYWYSIMLYALHIFAHKLNTCWVVFWLFVKQVISCKTIQTLINMVYLQAYFHTDQTRFHMKSLIIVWGLIFSGAGFVQKCLSPTSVAWVWCWPAAMCGYSLLLVIAWLGGFSFGFSCFPHSMKTSIFKFQLNKDRYLPWSQLLKADVLLL